MRRGFIDENGLYTEIDAGHSIYARTRGYDFPDYLKIHVRVLVCNDKTICFEKLSDVNSKQIKAIREILRLGEFYRLVVSIGGKFKELNSYRPIKNINLVRELNLCCTE